MKLADDLHLFIGRAYAANALVVLDGRRALMIEGMGGREDAKELKRVIEQDLGAEVTHIIQTHYFADHMAALALFPEAQVIAHEKYRETWEGERYRSEEEERHFREPTILVRDTLAIRWGKHRLDIFHNPGHTPSTLNVDIPTADLLHVGDTIVGNIVYLAYSTPERMAIALAKAKERGRKHILTSHGGVKDAEAIDRAMKYLDGMQPETLTDFERIFHARNVEQLAS